MKRNLYFLLAAGVLALDQATKGLVAAWLARGETVQVIPGLLNLSHSRNRGAAFGLLADYDSPWVAGSLIAFSVAALAFVLALLWRGSTARFAGVGLGLILGGAVGNLVDRILTGGVIDFLDVHAGPYHWPTFNLADSAIVVGAAVVLAEMARDRRRTVEES